METEEVVEGIVGGEGELTEQIPRGQSGGQGEQRREEVVPFPQGITDLEVELQEQGLEDTLA